MSSHFEFAIHNSQLISAADVRFRKECFPNGFRCVGCDAVMDARTDGKKRRPYFAHASGDHCSEETYLHKLAKRRFVESFSRCRAESREFVVSCWHPTVCKGVPNAFTTGCILDELRDEQTWLEVCHDLAARYEVVGEEIPFDSFVADVMLRNPKQPEDQIAIEFAVSHRLSDEKRLSGHRIIEIEIADEESILAMENGGWRASHPDPSRMEHLGSDGIRFFGFNPKERRRSIEQCGCSEMEYRLFVLKQNGKARLEVGSLAKLSQIYANEDGLWKEGCRLYFPDPHRESHSYIFRDGGYVEERAETFRNAWLELRRAGLPVKNCVICKHKRSDKFRKRSLYCVARRETVSSTNKGASCEQFMFKGE